jgi:hypothetical protein
MYLSLSIGSILVILVFTSVSTEMIRITVPSPSLIHYDNLRVSHTDTLRCPCSNVTISYYTFISLSASLHQVCSSDLIESDWLADIEYYFYGMELKEWYYYGLSQFQFWSTFCQMANTTINDAVNRFLSQSFVVSNLPTEENFDIQFNATVHQFYQSTITEFVILVETVNLLLQVDQPYMKSRKTSSSVSDPNLVIEKEKNETNHQESLQVCLIRK